MSPTSMSSNDDPQNIPGIVLPGAANPSPHRDEIPTSPNLNPQNLFDADDPVFVRNVNLLEILADDFPDTQPPPETAARTWSESEIKAWYQAGGVDKSIVDVSSVAKNETRPQQSPRPDMSHYPPSSLQTAKSWFPGFQRANNVAIDQVFSSHGGTLSHDSRKPSCRVVCWPNAGNAEDLFTNEKGRVDGKLCNTPSPLLNWCRTNNAHVFAPQFPGRAGRGREECFESCQEAAEALLRVVASVFFGDDDDESANVPWCVIGHSVGSWCAFEFVRLCVKHGFPQPKLALLSGFPSPSIGVDARPWRVNSQLNDSEFRDECTQWGVDRAVFKPHFWPTFEPLLRRDFSLFDTYEYSGKDTNAMTTQDLTQELTQECTPRESCGALRGVSLVTMRGANDSMITVEHVLGWRKFMNDASHHAHHEITNGNHLFPLQPDAKKQWLEIIAGTLIETFGGVE